MGHLKHDGGYSIRLSNYQCHFQVSSEVYNTVAIWEIWDHNVRTYHEPLQYALP